MAGLALALPLLLLSLSTTAAAQAAQAAQAGCRDRFLWPFSQSSIWNMPIGSGARFAPAGIFRGESGEFGPPGNFHNDQDFLIRATAADPLVPWFNQGDWGPGNHCTLVAKGPATHILLPEGFTSASDGGRSAVWQSNNNAMGLLLPDNITLVQMQPVYRCGTGMAPLLARWGNSTDGCPQQFPNTTSILGDGALGAHGGSGLSGFGGSIRLGELVPGAPPIRHALKLELYSHAYYFGAKPLQKPSPYNGGRTQYVWPATGSDSCSPHCYQGANPLLAPGALLAVPRSAAAGLNLTTEVGRRLLQALTEYGGYIVDDTANDSVAVCMDAAVNLELRSHYGFSMAYPHGVTAASATPGARALYRDLVSVFRALSIVTNNAPGTVGGGGTPLAPLAPPICDVD